MKPRREMFFASEGIPYLLAVAAVIAAIAYYGDPVFTLPPLLLLVYLTLLFRDPPRAVPPAPLGVVSPVDGTVTEVETVEAGALEKPAHRVVLRVRSMGTYTARSPVEAKIMDLKSQSRQGKIAHEAGGLWLRTDEGDDVILQFHGNRLGIPPRAFLRYGERVGQGQRCAYLRLTRYAELQLPHTGRVLVEPGQQVTAGTDLLAKLPHP